MSMHKKLCIIYFLKTEKAQVSTDKANGKYISVMLLSKYFCMLETFYLKMEAKNAFNLYKWKLSERKHCDMLFLSIQFYILEN